MIKLSAQLLEVFRLRSDSYKCPDGEDEQDDAQENEQGDDQGFHTLEQERVAERMNRNASKRQLTQGRQIKRRSTVALKKGLAPVPMF